MSVQVRCSSSASDTNASMIAPCGLLQDKENSNFLFSCQSAAVSNNVLQQHHHDMVKPVRLISKPVISAGRAAPAMSLPSPDPISCPPFRVFQNNYNGGVEDLSPSFPPLPPPSTFALSSSVNNFDGPSLSDPVTVGNNADADAVNGMFIQGCTGSGSGSYGFIGLDDEFEQILQYLENKRDEMAKSLDREAEENRGLLRQAAKHPQDLENLEARTVVTAQETQLILHRTSKMKALQHLDGQIKQLRQQLFQSQQKPQALPSVSGSLQAQNHKQQLNNSSNANDTLSSLLSNRAQISSQPHQQDYTSSTGLAIASLTGSGSLGRQAAISTAKPPFLASPHHAMKGQNLHLWTAWTNSAHDSETAGDSTSIISFNSSVEVGSGEQRKSLDPLNAKVEMVYSLLTMLGSQDRVDTSQTLFLMSQSRDTCQIMRQTGCIALLIQLLHPGDNWALTPTHDDIEVLERATATLYNLTAAQSDERKAKRDARILKILQQIRGYVTHLRLVLHKRQDYVEGIVEQEISPAMAALMKLSFDEDHRYSTCQLGGLHAIAELLIAEQLRENQLSQGVCSVADKSNVGLRRFIGMCLTNLTYGDGNSKATLCSMPRFLQVLNIQAGSGVEELRQVYASVLRNLSWKADAASKKALRDTGIVATLMSVAAMPQKETTLKSVLSALWNLSAHCSENKADICALPGALEFLVSTLSYKSPTKTCTIIENGGGILRNISSHIALREDYRKILRQHCCLQLLLKQLRSSSLTIVSNACGTLWNLSARNQEDQRALWEMGAVPMLKSLIHSKHRMISMGSSAALKNLLAAKSAMSKHDISALDQKSSECLMKTRKLKALESELDETLTDVCCDNLDSPKESPIYPGSGPGCSGTQIGTGSGMIPGFHLEQQPLSQSNRSTARSKSNHSAVGHPGYAGTVHQSTNYRLPSDHSNRASSLSSSRRQGSSTLERDRDSHPHHPAQQIVRMVGDLVEPVAVLQKHDSRYPASPARSSNIYNSGSGNGYHSRDGSLGCRSNQGLYHSVNSGSERGSSLFGSDNQGLYNPTLSAAGSIGCSQLDGGLQQCRCAGANSGMNARSVMQSSTCSSKEEQLQQDRAAVQRLHHSLRRQQQKQMMPGTTGLEYSCEQTSEFETTVQNHNDSSGDQATDYSNRYEEEEQCSSSKHQPTGQIQDTDEAPRTYGVEGTPLISHAGSINDLLQTTVYNSHHHHPRQDMSTGTLSSPGTPSKTSKRLCEAMTNSVALVRSSSETDIQGVVKGGANATPGSRVAEHPHRMLPPDLPDMTPMMFSRQSSCNSLDSDDQLSIKSTVYSEYSQNPTGIVSPTDLPESPGQTVPPSPHPERKEQENSAFRNQIKPVSGPVRNQSLLQQQTSSASGSARASAYASQLSSEKPSVDMDEMPKDFATEESDRASVYSGLSALTVDSEHRAKPRSPTGRSGWFCGPASSSNNAAVVVSSAQQRASSIDPGIIVNSNCNNDEEILQECIFSAMPNPKLSTSYWKGGAEGFKAPIMVPPSSSRSATPRQMTSGPPVGDVLINNSSDNSPDLNALILSAMPKEKSATSCGGDSIGRAAVRVMQNDQQRSRSVEVASARNLAVSNTVTSTASVMQPSSVQISSSGIVAPSPPTRNVAVAMPIVQQQQQTQPPTTRDRIMMQPPARPPANCAVSAKPVRHSLPSAYRPSTAPFPDHHQGSIVQVSRSGSNIPVFSVPPFQETFKASATAAAVVSEAPIVYAEEGTPVTYSRRSSISDLASELGRSKQVSESADAPPPLKNPSADSGAPPPLPVDLVSLPPVASSVDEVSLDVDSQNEENALLEESQESLQSDEALLEECIYSVMPKRDKSKKHSSRRDGGTGGSTSSRNSSSKSNSLVREASGRSSSEDKNRSRGVAAPPGLTNPVPQTCTDSPAEMMREAMMDDMNGMSLSDSFSLVAKEVQNLNMQLSDSVLSSMSRGILEASGPSLTRSSDFPMSGVSSTLDSIEPPEDMMALTLSMGSKCGGSNTSSPVHRRSDAATINMSPARRLQLSAGLRAQLLELTSGKCIRPSPNAAAAVNPGDTQQQSTTVTQAQDGLSQQASPLVENAAGENLMAESGSEGEVASESLSEDNYSQEGIPDVNAEDMDLNQLMQDFEANHLAMNLEVEVESLEDILCEEMLIECETLSVTLSDANRTPSCSNTLECEGDQSEQDGGFTKQQTGARIVKPSGSVFEQQQQQEKEKVIRGGGGGVLQSTLSAPPRVAVRSTKTTQLRARRTSENSSNSGGAGSTHASTEKLAASAMKSLSSCSPRSSSLSSTSLLSPKSRVKMMNTTNGASSSLPQSQQQQHPWDSDSSLCQPGNSSSSNSIRSSFERLTNGGRARHNSKTANQSKTTASRDASADSGGGNLKSCANANAACVSRSSVDNDCSSGSATEQQAPGLLPRRQGDAAVRPPPPPIKPKPGMLPKPKTTSQQVPLPQQLSNVTDAAVEPPPTAARRAQGKNVKSIIASLWKKDGGDLGTNSDSEGRRTDKQDASEGNVTPKTSQVPFYSLTGRQQKSPPQTALTANSTAAALSSPNKKCSPSSRTTPSSKLVTDGYQTPPPFSSSPQPQSPRPRHPSSASGTDKESQQQTSCDAASKENVNKRMLVTTV